MNKGILWPLLFLLWILMKLGEYTKKVFTRILIPLVKLVAWLFDKFLYLCFSLGKFYYYLIKKTEIKTLKKRGRPRTKSLFLLRLKKYNLTLKKLVPSHIRIGIALSLVILLIFFYSFFLVTIAQQLPTPTKLSETQNPMTTTIYDKNGTVLYRLYEGKNRSLVKLEELPPYLVQATIATEDKNFYKHPGVDITAILRASLAYVQNKQLQGGSTITQQLIKNTLLTSERTFQRKFREMFLAFWAERVFSKDQILQMYFNEVPYGGTTWGVAAAAQTIFGKNVSDLNLAESAFLAGLPASPTTFSPYGNNPQLAFMRQKEVLRRMVEDGYITKEQADEAIKQPLNIQPPINSIAAPHFVMYVRELLAAKYGERLVSQGGLKVVTTLDLNTQEMAEQVVADEVEKLKSLKVGNGAAVITEANTGHILAMVGSKNYFDNTIGSFNVATALRQPGSSIKPITYATGFKQGYSPATILLDTPVAFKSAWEVYAPVNYDGRFHGPVTVRTALGSSYNIPAVKMLAMVGIPQMIQTAKEMGITTFSDPSRYGLSLTLGGGEVKLVDMMSVYGTFSQMGLKYTPQAILKVTDANGNILEDNEYPQGKRVLSSGVAYLITDILQDNNARTPAFGPNSLLKIPGHTVAVKTGTTDSKRDNWTFGYTPKYVVGVWVGNNDNSPMDPTLTSGVTGASPIWNRLMTNLVKDQPNVAFKKPDDVAEGVVDGRRDLVLKGQAQKSVVGVKQPEKTITFTDPFSSYALEPQKNPQ